MCSFVTLWASCCLRGLLPSPRRFRSRHIVFTDAPYLSWCGCVIRYKDEADWFKENQRF